MSEIENFPEWKNLLGMALEGGYELKDIVEAERARAVLRVRVLGDYSLKATARFYVLEPQALQEQSAIWQAMRILEKHANLHLPLGTGTLALNGVEVVYAVFQNADETLQEVLSERPLSQEEATELLRSTARGLGELHSNGFVHGAISPREILAIGDKIDLSTAGVRRANSEPVSSRKSRSILLLRVAEKI